VPKKLKVGVVGTGSIARGCHIPAYQALDTATLVAGADIDAEARRAAKEDSGVPLVYDSCRAMLKAHPELDLISVCTNNSAHKGPTIECLNAGCDVLVEKPIAMNAREGLAMVKAAKKNGRRLMVGVNTRFANKTQALKRLLDEGVLGDVYAAKAIATRRRGIPSWGKFSSKKDSGGGPLIDIGIHCLDLAMHLMGYPKPITVSGTVYAKFGHKKPEDMIDWRWDPKKFSVEDYSSALVRFDNGASLLLEASWASNIDEDIFNVEILGDKGGCSWNPAKIYTSQAGVLLNTELVRVPGNQSHAEEIKLYIEAILKNKPTPAPAEEVLESQKVLDAIYKSAAAGKEVKITG